MLRYAELIGVQPNIIYDILRAVQDKLNTSKTEAINVAILNSYTAPAGD